MKDLSIDTDNAQNDSWPAPRTEKELNSWYDALVESVRMEVARIADGDEDLAAAKLLNLFHIDFGIVPDPECSKLELALNYNLKIRRKRPRYLPRAETICKRDEFAPVQIRRMLANLPPWLREISADATVCAYIEGYRYLLECQMAPDEGQSADDMSIDEVKECNEKDYPGELRRLYNQIRTGTLGK